MPSFVMLCRYYSFVITRISRKHTSVILYLCVNSVLSYFISDSARRQDSQVKRHQSPSNCSDLWAVVRSLLAFTRFPLGDFNASSKCVRLMSESSIKTFCSSVLQNNVQKGIFYLSLTNAISVCCFYRVLGDLNFFLICLCLHRKKSVP